MHAEVKIDRNILKCFSFPLKLQILLGSNRVMINERVVQTPTKWYNWYSFLWFIGATFSEVFYQLAYFYRFYHVNIILCATYLTGVLALYISYVTCLLMARFTKQQENIDVYSKLQNIDKLLSLQHDRYFTSFEDRLLITLTTLTLVLFPACGYTHMYIVVDKSFLALVLVPCSLTIYADCILCGAFLYHICVRLSIFIKMLENFICRYGEEPHEHSLVFIRWMSLVYPNVDTIGERKTLNPDKWTQCIEEILKSYKIITEISSYQILNIATTAFLWTFLAIGAVISALRTPSYPVTAAMLVAVWIGFYFLLLTVSAIINDWFLYQVKLTKLLCIRIMFYDIDDYSRKAASKMLQIINNADPKFLVYGLFQLNSSLVLTLLGVIASNVVVVVQFVVSNENVRIVDI